jgi:hypothetical protein
MLWYRGSLGDDGGRLVRPGISRMPLEAMHEDDADLVNQG